MTTPKQKNPIQHVEAGRHLTALDTDGDGQITVANAGRKMDIRWKTETGRRYRIQQSTNLKDWNPVLGCENVDGDGNFTECNLTGVSGPKTFYRI